MCGIAGWVQPRGFDGVRRLAHALSDGLRHRGPDGEGFLVCGEHGPRLAMRDELDDTRARLLLVHRRLSIVDLACGDQPMGNEDGTVWLSYNGEIFNHLMLRAELEAAGHRFRTHADTEVIVHGYEEWGDGVFGRLNGMFAAAIVDWRARRMVIARDHFGVKPLYYGWSHGGLWFSSEVKAVLSAGLVTAALREDVLAQYLTFRFVPAPATLFAGVFKLPAGHRLSVSIDELSAECAPEPFTAPAMPEDHDASRAEWLDRLADATRRSVAGQLMADVPVGAQLSGGLDSSIVVACMREAGPAPRTYAVGFAGEGADDELAVARRAAAVLGTEHRERSVTSDDYLDRWPGIVRSLDEPLANPGALLSRIVCELAREDLKVVLTGQGADEPLGGYPRHAALRAARVARALGAAAWLPVATALAGRDERFARFGRVLAHAPESTRFTELFAVFSPAEQASALLRPAAAGLERDRLESPVRYWLARAAALDDLNRFLYVDTRMSLADDLLIVGDKTAMAASVEARVPYLDRNVMSVAERMPSRFKVSLTRGRKSLQRAVGRRLLPPALAGRLAGWSAGHRRKLGFTTPFDRWFQSALSERLPVLLAGPDASLPEFLDRGAVRELIGRHVRGERDHRRQILALLSLEFWHREFIRTTPAVLGHRPGSA